MELCRIYPSFPTQCSWENEDFHKRKRFYPQHYPELNQSCLIFAIKYYSDNGNTLRKIPQKLHYFFE